MPEPVPVRPAHATVHLPPRGSLLGFDFGLARTGVAVGELETGQASALVTLHATDRSTRFEAISSLIDEWRPVALVVGIPGAPDNNAHAMHAHCRRFANQLRGRYRLPVFEGEERFSSAQAESLLREAGQHDWRRRKATLDAVAAQCILQHFLDARS